MEDVEQLKRENEELKRQLAEYQKSARPRDAVLTSVSPGAAIDEKSALTIIVLGASGDLAKKKTYPVLFSLYLHGLLPPNAIIYGFARSKLDDADFKKQISRHFKKAPEEKVNGFLDRCYYFSGQYNSAESFAELAKAMDEKESAFTSGSQPANRIFYMAIPPSIFLDVAKAIQPAAMSKTGWNRVIVEKPFGHDLDSSRALSSSMSQLFTEDQLYRIDHYLGKEMVQNLMVLRFANSVFEPVWNRNFVSNVIITFKEDIGTEGRGGYFDGNGIIRDVMQNHLIQILALVGMEAPISLSAEDVRDEKVKLLRAVSALTLDDLVIGQYTASPDGKTPGYKEDPGVPQDSVTPTFAAAVLHINNSRWAGTPFILKCGKALNERKAEIRIQFKCPSASLFPNCSAPNELVLRVQPNEAVYMKMLTKKPGLTTALAQSELDLSYKSRFEDLESPDAYERLIFDVIKGDHNLFVRDDELEAAWKIFTPILHQLEKEKIQPDLYEFGSRGPASADKLIADSGYRLTTGYTWPVNRKAQL
ncbi:glucose6-phosphate dehydrogenase, C-terminal domain containing protein [Acanthamoeba castellanii str. Neff]|uniref:Glucose-6-phosphate 1-dehydrogenase n=1 Tax=Acanthamoeba castellanii (strain ATCC 30010 / Neff) TaxID=1257118 RepID=L8GW58_ACACF|nr:glucose6-phosphate dehydrogenase, C-terminal domain containing protein [Acanthamoeba castellanii str. Neff]ELR16838.1 glucose6-phosphate dehydrogenase, C-terminal domain containing protein [Acanthamoeba castellanii str. Neff]